MATVRELFDQDELELILEALDHRIRYYNNRIPQQRINASVGSVKGFKTLEKYEEKHDKLARIYSVMTEEAIF